MKTNNTTIMRQKYDQYTEEHHKVWELMFQEQINILSQRATKTYLDGIQTVQFSEHKIPRFDIINKALEERTGWQVYAVPGIIDNKPFFELLAQKKFPATTWMRSLAQLKYIEEPDMFHDVFGHVPLLSEPYFAGFLNGLSQIALKHIENSSAIELMARIYWYTIEFGLIKEDDSIKIYGAGILSSPGESIYSLSKEPKHHIFDLDNIMETPYVKDKFQAQYFIAESYEQLYNSLSKIEQRITHIVASNILIEDGQTFKFSDLLIQV